MARRGFITAAQRRARQALLDEFKPAADDTLYVELPYDVRVGDVWTHFVFVWNVSDDTCEIKIERDGASGSPSDTARPPIP